MDFGGSGFVFFGKCDFFRYVLFKYWSFRFLFEVRNFFLLFRVVAKIIGDRGIE